MLPKLDESGTRKYTMLGARDPRPGAYGKYAVRWSETFTAWVIGNDPAYMLYKNHDMAQVACDALNRKWGFE